MEELKKINASHTDSHWNPFNVYYHRVCNSWLSKAFHIGVDHGPYDSFAIIQSQDKQEVVPGGLLLVHPQIKNDGNMSGMAIIHLTYPTMDDESPAYTWTVDEGWKELTSGAEYTYYGYTQVLSGGQETTELCNGMTLKEMTGEEFLNITDLGVGGTGYFFPTKEYSNNIDDFWVSVKDTI